MKNYSFINEDKRLKKAGDFRVEGRRFTILKWAYVFALNLSKTYGRAISILTPVKNSAMSSHGGFAYEEIELVDGAYE